MAAARSQKPGLFSHRSLYDANHSIGAIADGIALLLPGRVGGVVR